MYNVWVLGLALTSTLLVSPPTDAVPSETAPTEAAPSDAGPATTEPPEPEPAAPPPAQPAEPEPAEPPPAQPEPAPPQPAEPAPAPPGPHPAAPAAAPTPPPTPHDDHHAHHGSGPRWYPILRVGGLTDSDPLPDVGLAGLLTVGVHGPWVSFQAFGRAWLPRKGHLPGVEEPGVRAWAWAAGPRGCFRHVVSPKIETPACLGVTLGQIRGRSFGVDPQTVSTDFWAEGNVTVGVTLTPQKVPWLAIAGAFESGFRFKAPELKIEDVVYHEPSHTALRAFLALEFRLGQKQKR